jgi:hypothetical protein
MTTTLNASTAGAGGFIATSDNSGILALQTAGTTAVTIDTSQRVAFVAGTAALPAITTQVIPIQAFGFQPQIRLLLLKAVRKVCV